MPCPDKFTARALEIKRAAYLTLCAQHGYADAPPPPAGVLLTSPMNVWEDAYDAALLAELEEDRGSEVAQWGRAFVNGYAATLEAREFDRLIAAARAVEGETWRQGDGLTVKWSAERYAEAARDYWRVCDVALRGCHPAVPEIVLRALGGASFRAFLFCATVVAGDKSPRLRPDPIGEWAKDLLRVNEIATTARRAAADHRVSVAACGRKLGVVEQQRAYTSHNDDPVLIAVREIPY